MHHKHMRTTLLAGPALQPPFERACTASLMLAAPDQNAAIAASRMGLVQVCGLLDYGVDDHHLLLVLPRYPGSLREWRAKQKATSPHFLPLCLRIFQDVVQAVQVLARSVFCRLEKGCTWRY